MIKEIPLLFSAPMVRAVLEGRKTETRRTRGLEQINEAPDEWELVSSEDFPIPPGPGWLAFRKGGEFPDPNAEYVRIKSPYGVAGDKLWHREAYRLNRLLDGFKPSAVSATCGIWYEADGPPPDRFGKTRPAMFMCRWMSRTSSIILAAYPERLHDISESGAIAEGITDNEALIGMVARPYASAYLNLWDSLNGHGSAAKNPWCWVVKFEVMK